jgi:hypothetical protein
MNSKIKNLKTRGDLDRLQNQTGGLGLLKRFVTDIKGVAISIELTLVSVILLIGLLVGLASVRDSIVCEFADVAGSVGDINQSFTYNGVQSDSSNVSGSNYADATDSADPADDVSGMADQGIVFNLAPANEADAPPVSDAGTYAFTSSGSGSQSGTIGDGSIDTGFTVSTDTGSIEGNENNEVIFAETPGTAGTITTTFDDPLTEVELFVRSIANDTTGTPHVLGNFTVELSDGTTINNASFSIVNDAIAPNSTYGFFQTSSEDTTLITSTTIGGNQFIQDPISDGPGNQAAGRIQFTDSAITDAATGVGISSISFERSGGSSGYRSRFSVSGRVIQ